MARCSTLRRTRGFTLIEMLVALAITLIMMGAVVTLFGVMTDSVSKGRSAIEMSDRLRAARNTLQADLLGATASMTPPLRPEEDEGYFEIIEGPLNDYGPASDPTYGANWTLFGDVDDVLMFTTRSRRGPFLGRFGLRTIESEIAEVVYFLAQDPNSPPPVIDATTDPPTRLFTLYRRVLLIAPQVGSIPPYPPGAGATLEHFYDDYDVSSRFDSSSGNMIPNTLGDLTKRENRFAHYGDATFAYGDFPFPVSRVGIPTFPLAAFPIPDWPPTTGSTNLPGNWPAGHPEESAFLAPSADARIGHDVLLTNVLSFDVQVWDPTAPVRVENGVALEPGDVGWSSATTIGATGAYVDLGYHNTVGSTLSVFSDINPNARPTIAFPQNTAAARVYDTWSLHYENDGLDDVGDPITSSNLGDRGLNGLDDDGDGIVDDLDEYDTLPPYYAPLRGIRIKIRVYEPSSQQVREAVIVQDFTTK